MDMLYIYNIIFLVSHIPNLLIKNKISSFSLLKNNIVKKDKFETY